MVAIIFGAAGGIGAAFVEALGPDTIGFSRHSAPALDLEDETSIAAAAAWFAAQNLVADLMLDATGFLHGNGFRPEKSWAGIDREQMLRNFAINAVGPALLMKHFLPLLPRNQRGVFVTLSAKVGSIGDNASGGWYSYRAAKAALNQITHTAALELRRHRPLAICVAMHPGTVETKLSAPFAKTGLTVRSPALAVAQMLPVISGLNVTDTGGFFSYDGSQLPW